MGEGFTRIGKKKSFGHIGSTRPTWFWERSNNMLNSRRHGYFINIKKKGNRGDFI